MIDYQNKLWKVEQIFPDFSRKVQQYDFMAIHGAQKACDK